MPAKRAQFIPRGMTRDLAVSKFNSEYAYENKNLRITATDENTAFVLSNEKGNREADIAWEGSEQAIEGTPIGQQILNDKLILFTASDSGNSDSIYKFWFDESGNTLSGKRLFSGPLEFSTEHPIESIGIYENEDIQKVYWTDGYNQPRVINIEAIADTVESWQRNPDVFNFIRKLSGGESVNVTKNLEVGGEFAPGVIQYYFTYFDMYGQETNIFASSPLLYTSYLDRGASPDSKVSTGFNIKITDVDPNFDKIRIYSILRTSLDAVPQARIVKDIQIQSSIRYEYSIDFDNAYIHSEDPTSQSFFSNFVVASENGNLNLDEVIIRDSNGVDKTLAEYNNNIPSSACPFTLFKKPNTGSEHWAITDIVINTDSISLTKTVTPGQDWGTVSIPVGNITSCKEWYGVNVSESPTGIDYNSYEYIDTGIEGQTIDPTVLLFKNRAPIVAGTLSQKDNTLFLGNIKSKVLLLPKEIKDEVRAIGENLSITEEQKTLCFEERRGSYYGYDNQLKYDSNQIKTFKYLDYYRLGLQFKHETGYWSEAVFVKDYQIVLPQEDNNGKLIGNYLRVRIQSSTLFNKLYSLGYREVRPVIVYPSLNDRECICQGILCPTVYNTMDRINNSPFAQSSWFIRPTAPFDPRWGKAADSDVVFRDLDDRENTDASTQKYSENSLKGLLSNTSFKATANSTERDFFVSQYGAWPEFRHNYPIPGNTVNNGEIQCIVNPPHPYLGITTLLNYPNSDINYTEKSTSKEWALDNQECFYVDQSIVTFHSPDIEFDTTLHNFDFSKLKLRIVGMIKIGSSISDISIQTSTSALPIVDKDNDITTIANGFNHQQLGALYNSNFGWKSLIASLLWFDGAILKSKDQNYLIGYMVYPWQRNGSLNNDKKEKEDYTVSSLLKRKVQSTLRYASTKYFNTVWYAEEENSSSKTGISGAQIFDSNELSLIKIPAPQNSSMQDINYYGNVDKVVIQHLTGKAPLIDGNTDKFNGSILHDNVIGVGGMAAYPIVIGMPYYYQNPDNDTYAPNQLFNGTARPITAISYVDNDHIYASVSIGNVKYTSANDPVSMKYKSTPHAVIAFNYTTDKKQRILPYLNNVVTIKYNGDEDWYVSETSSSINRNTVGSEWIPYEGINAYNQHPTVTNNPLFWDEKGDITGVSQDRIDYNDEEVTNGYLWLGELYNDNVVNRFGGTSEEAFANNNWLPCGDSRSFNSNATSLTVNYLEGDTYFQRYDCLKTYPYTQEDQNSIVDIISFVCETRVNIDGRYDRNRGLTNNLNITPQNFNLLNPVYSQADNFLIYHGKDSTKIEVTDYPNTLTWTKTKTLGEEVDSWTDVTMASTLDLDGDLGQLRALRRFGDNIIAFQDNGISQILYNDNVQIASTTGVPIEIANSGKVSGKRYITNQIGCTNKWSICSTPNGLYFIDDLRKDFYLFNGQLNNISERLGFHSWMIDNFKNPSVWNPRDFDNCTTLYDRVNDEVLITLNDAALAFSENLNGFTSFYDYGKTPFMSNLKDRVIAWHTDSSNKYAPWMHHEGEYNSFYGEYKPFWTTVIVNPDPTMDKVFNNVEYRADIFDMNDQAKYLKDASFDTLNVWNEYQAGVANLENIKNIPSNLKKKFRIWRANIPRWNIDTNGQTANGRDRMRNPWLYLKLSMEKSSNLSNNHKTILHDMIVDYFE